MFKHFLHEQLAEEHMQVTSSRLCCDIAYHDTLVSVSFSDDVLAVPSTALSSADVTLRKDRLAAQIVYMQGDDLLDSGTICWLALDVWLKRYAGR